LLWTLFQTTARNDDIALAFKTRNFTSHSIGEALRLLHGMFADNQFVRLDQTPIRVEDLTEVPAWLKVKVPERDPSRV